jgi:hypothetical protein
MQSLLRRKLKLLFSISLITGLTVLFGMVSLTTHKARAASQTYTVVATSDNQIDEFWVNDQKISFSGGPEWWSNKKGTVTTSTPTKISIKATNTQTRQPWSGNPAMVIFTIYDASNNVVARSGDFLLQGVAQTSSSAAPAGWHSPAVPLGPVSYQNFSGGVKFGADWGPVMTSWPDNSARFMWPTNGVDNVSLDTAYFYGDLSPPPPPPPPPSSRPYFKVFGNDVFTGGGFFSNGSCNTSTGLGTTYQDDQTLSSDPRYGSVMAVAKVDSSFTKPQGGASSQYGAISLGKIEGSGSSTDPAHLGFYSQGAFAATGSSSDINSLTFANNGSKFGGSFQGLIRQSHCVPDYFGTKQNNPHVTSGDVSGLSSLNGQYLFGNPGVTTVNGGAIANGRNVTLFINGDAYINGNITYLGGYDTSSVPKFALVVKGNIYIDPSVTELDGLYIAQPKPNISGFAQLTAGVLWTCHDSNTTDPSAAYLSGPCSNQKLVVKGAVIARQVNLSRTKGDVNNASTAEDSLPNALGSSNIAEIIDFTPEMVIGGGFFSPSSATSYNVESLISLPPAF